MSSGDIASIVVVAAGVGCAVRMQAISATTAPKSVAPRRLPCATMVGVVVIGVVSTLQLTVAPGLLDALERNASQISAGQVWRLVTSLCVQDGGVAGTVWNLALLAVLGTIAERVLGWRPGVWAWVCGTLAGELAGLWWQPIGAGNSVGNFGLIGLLCVAALVSRDRPVRLSAAIVLAGGCVLLVDRDVHGAALAAGLAGSWILRRHGFRRTEVGRAASGRRTCEVFLWRSDPPAGPGRLSCGQPLRGSGRLRCSGGHR